MNYRYPTAHFSSCQMKCTMNMTEFCTRMRSRRTKHTCKPSCCWRTRSSKPKWNQKTLSSQSNWNLLFLICVSPELNNSTRVSCLSSCWYVWFDIRCVIRRDLQMKSFPVKLLDINVQRKSAVEMKLNWTVCQHLYRLISVFYFSWGFQQTDQWKLMLLISNSFGFH